MAAAKKPDMDPNLAKLGVEGLKKARDWMLARVALRRVMDSKSAPAAQLEAAKREYNKKADELEKAMFLLEKHVRDSGARFPTTATQKKGEAKPFPWQSFLGMVAAGAGALEKAVSTPGAKKEVWQAEVVDVTDKGK